jgi:hypothetical protein
MHTINILRFFTHIIKFIIASPFSFACTLARQTEPFGEEDCVEASSVRESEEKSEKMRGNFSRKSSHEVLLKRELIGVIYDGFFEALYSVHEH